MSPFIQWRHHFSNDVTFYPMASHFTNCITIFPLASHFTYCITIFPHMTPFSNDSNDVKIFQWRHQSSNNVIILPMMSWHHDITISPMTSPFFQWHHILLIASQYFHSWHHFPMTTTFPITSLFFQWRHHSSYDVTILPMTSPLFSRLTTTHTSLSKTCDTCFETKTRKIRSGANVIKLLQMFAIS
jgi:hypothetical protein